MNRRMIDASMWQNEHFAELPMGARLLQIGIINHADDQGRVKANPAWLRAQVFPYDNLNTDEVQGWLDMMAANQTIILYTVDGKQYAQLNNWWKYQSLQYAQPSQYPRPEGWQDRIRKTVTKGLIATCNWYTVDGTRLEDTCDMDGKLLPKMKLPKPSTPSSNGASAPDSPAHSGESTPVRSPEDTIELNRIEEELKTTTTAPARETGQSEGEATGSGGSVSPPKKLDGWGEVVNAYESNIGMFTQLSSEMVQAAVVEYGPLFVVDAIKESVRQNVRKWSYVDGVLRRWKANGRDSPKPKEPERKLPQVITIFNQYTNQYEERKVS
jgi:DnaD/phage-associated family protein